MSNHIDKDNPNRWFYVQNNGTGKDSLIMFGNLGEVGQAELESGQSILINYLTEDELEIQVNIIANDNEYYKDQVESESTKFMMPSEKY